MPTTLPITMADTSYSTRSRASNVATETRPLLGDDERGSPRLDHAQFSLAQGAILICLGVFTFGQMTFLAPWAQQRFAASVSSWWADSMIKSPDDDSDDEFLLASPAPFFALFGMAPLAVAVVLYEAMVRGRIASRWRPSSLLWRLLVVLRCKPRVSRWTSCVSIGDSLLFTLFLVAGNILVVWYAVQSQRARVERHFGVGSLDSALGITGIAFGYGCMFNLGFLLLPSARNFAWLEFVNVSYANGVKYHRWLGWAALIALVLHVLPFYWLWYRQGTLLELTLPCFSCSLEYMSPGYAAWMVVFGEVSTLLLLVIGVTSLPSIRRRNFEVFAKCHRLAGLAILFAILHWAPVLWWLLPGLALVYVGRIKSMTAILSAPLCIEECAVLPGRIIKIVAVRERGSWFELGQFVYLVAPGLDKEQMHPITIASSPRSSASRFTLLVKELGDWTHDLARYVEHCMLSSPRDAPDIRLDGFYGSSLEIYDRYPVVCLLGGGIGATPLFAILEDMLAARSSEQPRRQQRVFVTFAFRELSLLEHIHHVLVRLKQSELHGAAFTFNLSLTCEPSDEELDRIVSAFTGHGKPFELSGNGASIQDLSSGHRPFATPLHSRVARTLAYAVMFVAMTALVFWLEAGGGLVARWTGSSNYWPLQRAIEVFSLGFVARITAMAIPLEKRARQADETMSISSVSAPHGSVYGDGNSGQAAEASVLTVRNMIAMHNVQYGRPDLQKLMKAVRDETLKLQGHHTGEQAVCAGVFMSGPTAMKRQAECAVAELGVSYFDVHEEEFEL